MRDRSVFVRALNDSVVVVFCVWKSAIIRRWKPPVNLRRVKGAANAVIDNFGK